MHLCLLHTALTGVQTRRNTYPDPFFFFEPFFLLPFFFFPILETKDEFFARYWFNLKPLVQKSNLFFFRSLI